MKASSQGKGNRVKMALFESDASKEVKRLTTEKSVIDAAARVERHVASSALRQIEEFAASDPATHMARNVSELERMEKIAGSGTAFDAVTGAPRIPLSLQMKEMEKYLEGDRMMESRLRLDYDPPRINVRLLEDIRHSLRSQAQQQAESVQAAIVDHIRQRQEGLEGDQQLLVYCETGSERIQVRQINLPNHHAMILDGVDANGNLVSLIATMNNVKITCKVETVPPPNKPYRVGFVRPVEDAAV